MSRALASYRPTQVTKLLHQPTWTIAHGRNLDLHKGNIAFEIPNLDGKSKENAMMTLELPHCVPVFTRDHLHQTDLLPKYLVLPGNLVEYVKQEDLRVKIIDLGEGSLS